MNSLKDQAAYGGTKFSVKENLGEAIFMLIVILFPWLTNLPNYLIVALVLVKMATFDRNLELESLKANRFWIFINIGPFVFIVITLLYTLSFREGLKSFEQYALMLAFPLIIPCLRLKKGIAFYFRLFAISLIVMCMFCLLYNSFIFITVPLDEQATVGDLINKVESRWNAFTSENLTRPFDINPIYMSMYLTLAMGIIVFDKMNKRLKIVLLLFMAIFQMLLASRVGTLAMLICTVLLILYHSEKVRKRKVTVSVILVISGFIALLFLNPILKKRYINDFNSFQTPQNITGWNGANIRYVVWECSWDAFKQSPIMGYGIGSENAEREKCYKNYTFYGVFGTSLNSHNQFLEFSLIGGVILVGLFMAQVCYSAIQSLRYNSPLFFLFVICFVIICLAESVLQRQKGVIFFSLFNSLFLATLHGFGKPKQA